MNENLKQAIALAIQEKKFLKIQYYTDINEFLTVTGLIKQFSERDGVPTIALATGLEIPFDQLVRVGKVAADKYDDGFFQCSL